MIAHAGGCGGAPLPAAQGGLGPLLLEPADLAAERGGLLGPVRGGALAGLHLLALLRQLPVAGLEQRYELHQLLLQRCRVGVLGRGRQRRGRGRGGLEAGDELQQLVPLRSGRCKATGPRSRCCAGSVGGNRRWQRRVGGLGRD